MNKFIELTSDDVALLVAIPKTGCDLSTIVRSYVSLQRAAPPSYDLVQDCLSKALKAGIVLREEKEFRVEENWFKRINQDDYGQIFEEEFVGKPIAILRDVEFSVNEHEYKVIERINGA